MKKDEQNLTKFEPSQKMIALLRAKLDIEVKPTITAECKAAGISRTTYYLWLEDNNFVKWFNDQWDKEMYKTRSYLDKVGLRKASKEYKYWEALQMKYHNFKRAGQLDVNILDKEELEKIKELAKKYD